jgi:hypothetical protein
MVWGPHLRLVKNGGPSLAYVYMKGRRTCFSFYKNEDGLHFKVGFQNVGYIK